MLGLLLLATGIFFAALFALNGLIRTMRRSTQITFSETLLAFLAVLLPVSALVEDNRSEAALDAVESMALWLAGGLLVFSLLLLLAELFRPQRLRASRGVFGLGMSAIIGLSALLIPYASIYITTLNAPPPLPTPVNNAVSALREQEDSARFRLFFNMMLQIIVEETGLDAQTVLKRLNQDNLSVAQLAKETGGSLDTIIDRLIMLMRAQVDDLLAVGRINALEASGAKLVIPSLVRSSVANDMQSLSDLLSRENPSTPSPEDATRQADSFATFMAISPTPAAAPTLTASPSPSPSLTRTPRPTTTATATRDRYLTRTPTATPTLPNPCVALLNYNVNLRAAPDFTAAVLLTIPFETVVTVFGRSADSQWWFATYEDHAGWLNADFITLSSACAALPVRRP